MLEDALGSRSKVRILRTLVWNGGNPATTDDIVRATGQSTGTIVPALAQLAAQGLLAERQAGRSRAFTLSPDHPATPVVRGLFQQEARVLDDQCRAVLAGLAGGGVRFAFYSTDDEKSSEGPRARAHLTLIVDDVAVVARHLEKRAAGTSVVVADALAASGARDALNIDSPLRRRIDAGRVIFADDTWLAK